MQEMCLISSHGHFFHAMQRLSDFFGVLQMAIEAHKWATMLVHEYGVSNFIRCMICSSGSGMKTKCTGGPMIFEI